MITFLYKRRPDDTYVIAHQGNPYHVIPDDPLYAQCVEDYAVQGEEPPDEPEPAPIVVPPDPIAELRARIEALEGIG
jgi:hypothetical protein